MQTHARSRAFQHRRHDRQWPADPRERKTILFGDLLGERTGFAALLLFSVAKTMSDIKLDAIDRKGAEKPLCSDNPAGS
jgi:hypothetical protein